MNLRTALLSFLVCGAAAAQTPPLALKEVLDSTLTNYPPLLAAIQDRVIADSDLTTAEGRFDLNTRASWYGNYFGPYENQNYDLGVDQATQFQGMSYFSGYRLGRGDYASYDGKSQTDTAGEWRVGVKMPLLRNRAIDPRRGELLKATIGRRIADLGIDQQRILIVQLATRRYWDWVAAGRRLQVARAVLDVATRRDRQLKDAADFGQIPRIDVTDNQQAILNRTQQSIGAERGLQQAAIDLSLFYRDSAGNPVLVSEGRLPPGFPEIHDLDEQRLKDDLELALARRPEIQQFRAQREQVGVDLGLARNLLLPALDLGTAFYQDMGAHVTSRGPTQLTAGVNFEMPVQRRQAKGLEAAALARIEQVDQRERFARDQVTAEVRDAHSAVTQAFRQAQVLHEQVGIAHQLEDAERVRFDLGEGTLFLINLREQVTFDTALREIGAVNEYYRALALYEFAIAEGLNRRPAVRH